MARKKEEKRLETLINWKKKTIMKKDSCVTDYIKVNDISPIEKENEKIFINVSRKSMILVIKTKLVENKSENLVKAVSQWIIYDYLSKIKKYISPELANSINNFQIVRILRSIKDYEAERLFISSSILDEKTKKLTDKIQELVLENLYDTIFIPFLLKLDRFDMVKPEETKIYSEKLLYWLTDYEKRLEEPFKSKYFPKIEFLYVKMFFKDLTPHEHRAIEKFEEHNCDMLIISGWYENKKDIEILSRKLSKNYNYPSGLRFKGQFLRHKGYENERYEKRFNIIHKKSSFQLF